MDTANVCLCGHWSASHRGGGKATCEGMRCGCYTFRQLTTENCGVGVNLPKCPKCGSVLTGRTVTLGARGMTLIVEWKHLMGNSCKTIEQVKMDEEAAERIKAEARQRNTFGDAGAFDEDEFEYEYTLDDPVGAKAKARAVPKPEPPKPELTGRAPLALEEEV